MVQDYDATAKQKHAIALLCKALGIQDEIEQRPMTMGAAGKLIRELTAEVRARRRRHA